MTTENVWEHAEVVAEMNAEHRTIDLMCPPIRRYLTPGSSVLDVGCGAGRFTRDVASVVRPGTVKGVDLSRTSIAAAQESARAEGAANLSFQVGSAYDLEFADDTFDFAYSVNLAVWLHDPVRALAEQRRVTKPGGWVGVQLADYGNIIFYPPCPSIDRFLGVLPQLHQAADPDGFIDSHQARRAVEIMSAAGLRNVQLEGWAQISSPTAEDFGLKYDQWRNFVLDPEGLFKGLHQRLIALGAMDRDAYAAARAELDAWHASPHALSLQTSYWATGQAT